MTVDLDRLGSIPEDSTSKRLRPRGSGSLRRTPSLWAAIPQIFVMPSGSVALGHRSRSAALAGDTAATEARRESEPLRPGVSTLLAPAAPGIGDAAAAAVSSAAGADAHAPAALAASAASTELSVRSATRGERAAGAAPAAYSGGQGADSAPGSEAAGTDAPPRPERLYFFHALLDTDVFKR